MLKRTKLFAQISGYLLIAALSSFGLMAMLGMGGAGRAFAAVQQQLAEGHLGVAVPSSMNYQGILRDGDGNLIASGEYDLTFKIYASLASPQPLYEQSQAGIIVRDGRFSTTLSAIPSTVYTEGKDRFIGVTVEPFAEMVPRERLASVPYAVQAEDAFNGVPVGGVVDWWRPSAAVPIPAGYQLCDGSVVTDPDSPYVGQNTPDLRGQMVRGATEKSDELATGGAPSQTVNFGNIVSHAAQTVSTAAAGGHQHSLGGYTGSVSAVQLADPGTGDYWVRDDNNRGWSNQSSIAVFENPATQRQGEGNHYHSSGTLIANAAGDHGHQVTLPTLAHSGTQTISILPPYTNLLKICRIR